MHTTAFWLHFPAEFLRTFPQLSAAEIQNSLVAAGNLMKTIAALLLMCDARDISLSLTDDTAKASGIWEPDLFLYDNYPGGIGHRQPLFTARERHSKARWIWCVPARARLAVRAVWARSAKWGSRGRKMHVRCLRRCFRKSLLG